MSPRGARGRPAAALVAGLAALSTACASPTRPDSPGPLVVEPIEITSVRVFVGPAAQAEVSAHVQGIVGDGCARLLPATQVRTGQHVLLWIPRQRPSRGVCTQIAQLFDEVVTLEGRFLPGAYTLQVNAVEVGFIVP